MAGGASDSVRGRDERAAHGDGPGRAAGWPLMSVAAHASSHIGAKRLFEPAESPEFGPGKRLRHLSVSPPSSRARGPREGRAYVVTATTLAALQGLFPDMDEKVGPAWAAFLLMLGTCNLSCLHSRLRAAPRATCCTTAAAKTICAGLCQHIPHGCDGTIAACQASSKGDAALQEPSCSHGQ